MTVIEVTETQLIEEIAQLQSKINSLESHLNELQAQPDSDTSISGDASPEEIIKRAKKLAQQQQQAVTRSAEEKVVEKTLKLLGEELQRKEEALLALKRSSEFERLRHKAVEFNHLIDQAVRQLEEMQKISEEIKHSGYTPLAVTAELRELMYCSIHPTIIRVRRRGDVLRGA